MWVGRSVAAVKPPQAVMPAAQITLTFLPASPKPIFRLFCSDAIVVLWRYWAVREVNAKGGEGVNGKACSNSSSCLKNYQVFKG